MHRQAHEVLPALFDRAGARRRSPWLFGHSDGGSIALLYAARFPERVAGLVVLAPHIFVEDVTVANIEHRPHRLPGAPTCRRSSAATTTDADSAFWGWNRIWLHPPFREWNIEAELDTIRCPVLAMQGIDDEYGTLRRSAASPRASVARELLEIPECGHSPHRDQPDRVIVAATSFITKNRRQTP